VTLKKSARLERLLARGRLGGPARERIFDRALRAADVGGRAGARRWRWRWRWPIRLAPVAIGIAIAIVLVRPRPTDVGFRTKGAGADAPLVEAICTAPADGGCPRQGKLAIRVQGLSEAAFLTGYVTPAGTDIPETRRWFSPPGAREPAQRVEAGEAARILPQGLPLDAFEPGRYDVHLRLVTRPASRADALAAPAIARSITPLTVLP
jgi:hypothetical protein